MPIQILRGDDNDNNLYGSYGDDQLEGQGGNDQLIGLDGNDILIGGRGDDFLDGGAGNNTYVFGRGDGVDRIVGGDPGLSKHNVLQLGEDIGPADVVLERTYSDLIVHLAGSNDRVEILGYFATGAWNGQIHTPQRIQEIHFADGSSWDNTAILSQLVLQEKGPLLQLGAADDFFYADGRAVDGGGGNDRLDGGYTADLLQGGAGDDTLLGNDGDDVLRGGAGSDSIHGGNGDDVMAGGGGDDALFADGGFDTVVFGRGDGHDTVQILPWSQGLTIALGAELLPAAVVLTRVDTGSSIDLDIAVVGSNDHLTIAGYYSGPQPITNLRFADGTVWTASDIDQHAMTPPVPPIMGGDGPDNLNGSYGDDVLIGGAGNDVLVGGGGNNVLLGGDGDDVLIGGPGHEVLDGGAGNDLMLIFDGDHTILLGRGTGADQVNLQGSGMGIEPTMTNIVLGADLGPADLRITAVDGDSVFLKIEATGDSVLLSHLLNFDGTPRGAVALHFADGSSWDATAILREMLSGDAGNNTLLGNPADNTMDGKGGDDLLLGFIGNDRLLGGAGNDVLDGGDGNDTLTGGTDMDQLMGGNGADTYVFQRGDGADLIVDGADGNSIRFGAGVAPADVSIVRAPGTLWIRYGDYNDRIEIRDFNNNPDPSTIIDQFVFADGTVRHYNDLLFNLAPQLNVPLQDVHTVAGQPVYVPVYSQTFVDPDFGDKITYSMTLEDGAPLPAWLSFDGTMLSGTPANGGTFSLKLTATDLLGATGSEVFNLRIDAQVPPNSAPTVLWAASELRLAEGIGFDKQVAAFTDPDAGDELTLTATLADGSPLPSWMALDAYSGKLIGMADYQSSGVYAVKVVATDRGGLSVNSVVTITVDDVNRAPVLAHAIADATAQQGQTFSMAVSGQTFADPDVADKISYSMTMEDGAPLPAWLSFNGETLSGTPTGAAMLSLKLIATDLHGASGSDVFSLRVDPDNAPTVKWTASDLRLPEGYSFGKAVPVFADADAGDVLTLAVTLADGSPLPSWMAFDAANSWLTGVTSYQSSGVYAIKTVATDRAGLSVASTFTITVDDVNRAPVLAHAIADATAAQGLAFTMDVSAQTFTDPDLGDKISYSMTMEDGAPLPAWLSFNGLTLSGTPASAATLSLKLIATDQKGATASDVFSLRIAPDNAPTVKWAATDMHVPEGYGFGKAVPTFTDPDAGDVLTLAVTLADGSPLPSWMAFDAANSWLTGTTSYQSSGVYAIKTVATDRAGLSVASTFTITVDNVDRAPVLGHAIVDATATEAAAFSVTLPLDTFSDPDGDSLVWSASGMPAWMSFDAQTHSFSGTPADTDVGSIDITVSAVDAGGLSVQDVFTVKVAQAAALTLTGTPGADVLIGMSNNDSLYGQAGDDQLTGNRGNDLLDGGLGADSMAGGLGNDRYVVDNGGDVVTESAGQGFDQVSSSIGYTLGANVEMLTLTGGGSINGSGNGSANVLQGNAGANILNGMGGADILQGGGGNDMLTGTAGVANVLDGGTGTDQLNGGSGNELFIGGAGNDVINPGGGRDIIVFNRGDGQDTVNAASANNTLSLGHGILYADLSLRKSGNDLILSTGSNDQITFKSWYAGNSNHSVSTLQVVIQGGSDYQPGSASAINDNKVEQFNFSALVTAFDTARSSNPSLTSWAMASSLAARATGGSDSAAFGGDLAHDYALYGSLSSIGAAPALTIVGSASFGSAVQAFGAVSDGTPVLY